MAATTMQQMRSWDGPAILSYGFRPFFLLGALWAAAAMVLWLGMLGGWLLLPTALDPVSWHAHAFVIGYLTAIIAGFLLTAVPNWTGRLPVVGKPLGWLVALWLTGRAAMSVSALLPPVVTAVLDMAFPVALAGFLAREIIAGRNWRNLIVLAMLSVLILGNGLFHWEAARGESPAHGIGLRLILAAGVMMISVIGGRIVPSFTRNWLVKAGSEARPAAPMQGFDKVALLVTVASLLAWVFQPHETVTGVALLVCGAVQLARLARWCGHRTLREPLVTVLHVAYGFVPLGALGLGWAILSGSNVAAAQHLWMAGAIGLMTLAVMTRATLGHTGAALSASLGTSVIYLSLIGAVLARFVEAYDTASGLWIVAFGGFALIYGPRLLRPRTAQWFSA